LLWGGNVALGCHLLWGVGFTLGSWICSGEVNVALGKLFRKR